MKSRMNIKFILSFFLFLIIIILENNNYINYLKRFYERKRINIIPIAFSVDNNYLYPLIVLLTSILLNSNPTTFYSFHIMIPYDFYSNNKRKIVNLSKQYNNCKINFYNLGKKYLDWRKTNKHYTQTVYFRLSLPDLVKNFDKIIYLDCDTMVHKDLTELYQINMKDKFFLGFPGIELSYLSINGTRNFINSGVMLINLKLLRKINSSLLFENYYKSYGTKKVDEYLIIV